VKTFKLFIIIILFAREGERWDSLTSLYNFRSILKIPSDFSPQQFLTWSYKSLLQKNLKMSIMFPWDTFQLLTIAVPYYTVLLFFLSTGADSLLQCACASANETMPMSHRECTWIIGKLHQHLPLPHKSKCPHSDLILPHTHDLPTHCGILNGKIYRSLIASDSKKKKIHIEIYFPLSALVSH